MLVMTGSQLAALNAASVAIGRHPSREYLIEICGTISVGRQCWPVY